MGKKPLVIFAGVGMTLGAYLPVLVGVDDGLGPWSLLGGFVGGILGIWLGIAVMKRYG